MNPDFKPEELDRLFALARQRRLETSALEYGFETRLLARIQEKRLGLFSYSSMAWRLIPVFSCLVLVVAFWYHTTTLETDQAESLVLDQSQESVSPLGEVE